jgi:hypothetical protein
MEEAHVEVRAGRPRREHAVGARARPQEHGVLAVGSPHEADFRLDGRPMTLIPSAPPDVSGA